ncbi:insulinase family protein [Qipengyuania sp. JC766]|uniref:M16 family metallopeptidase n=1 Tax=Qipengyuania sp. JC766 TaxID=3232139 RepID=UPI0034576DBC
MISTPRAVRPFAFLLSLPLFAAPLAAQDSTVPPLVYPTQAPAPEPEFAQPETETPWMYEGSDIPVDREWLFGEIDNGLRYATRTNGVPPDQVSIRIRIDAGSLHEEDSERGYAHLLEHLLFRESQYLGPAQAIPTWQRLGASFGNDTNAETSPTHTLYKLDLPGATPAKLEESFKLLSGMIRQPVLSQANVDAEVPIVLAEKRESAGPARRVAEQERETLFAGQRLAERLPIGTEETLRAATGPALEAFHERWYRPEKTVVAVAGDFDRNLLASMIEKYFGDWDVPGETVDAPDFGDPVPPAGVTEANPVGEVAVIAEPNLPRRFTYAYMRPWRQQDDTILMNEERQIGYVAQALINRRLEARARAGGSFVVAGVSEEAVSRSANLTLVSFTPLDSDWQAALDDVRGVIADALETPPTEEEIAREVSEIDVAYENSLEQAEVEAAATQADNLAYAVDIRETVGYPRIFLDVLRSAATRMTPEKILSKTRELFDGDVIRATYVTPDADEASEPAVRTALLAPAEASSDVRLAAQDIAFDDLPPIGTPGTVVSAENLGIFNYAGLRDVERVTFSNGTSALLWSNNFEPGRIAVKMRFGAGRRAFTAETAPYIELGEIALVSSGFGEFGAEEIDRLATGRKFGLDFAVEEGVFTLTAQTRRQDLDDQLYLFAAKLGDPNWDPNPVRRAIALQSIGYQSFSTNPAGILQRDLPFYSAGEDPRYASATPAQLEAATAEGFREVWSEVLQQGPVEVLIFGEFDRDATIETLRRTIGALPQRSPLPEEIANRKPGTVAPGAAPTVVRHSGDADQAAAGVIWNTGGGIASIRESRQLDILTEIFQNRLFDAMRERAGASYSPAVFSNWPRDVAAGGTITALAQVPPDQVSAFFAAAESIAQELATTPPTAEELQRATEPLGQLIQRASSGNGFWLWQLEGASTDQRRAEATRGILSDYSVTTPQRMQQLAAKYLTGGFRLAVLPEGETLGAAATAQEPELATR